MCTLIYSAKSHRKIAHFPHCKILKRIPKESRRTFDSLEDAREHGYRICQCCPPAAQKYRKERKRVREFCKAHGLAVEILNGVVNVYSRHDVWKIIVEDKRNTLRLYHKNYDKRCQKEGQESVISGFHHQGCRYKTVFEFVEYIVSHDEYRDEHPYIEKLLSD